MEPAQHSTHLTHWDPSRQGGAYPTTLPGLQDPSGLLARSLGQTQQQLNQFLRSPDALQRLHQLFQITNPAGAIAILGQNLSGSMVLPQIQVLEDATLNGSRGAYSTRRNTIYLAQSLLEGDRLVGEVSGVLLEEIGHYFDSLLNPGGDTPGDEGERFKHTVLGGHLDSAELQRIRTEQDWGVINVNGEAIWVEQDNSLETALNIGTLSGSRTLTGFIGGADVNDFYRFTLGATSDFTLNLSGLTADADVELLNSSGTVIERSFLGSTASETIARRLAAGTYYIRIYPFSGSTNYNLALTARSIAVDNAGNTLSTARSIGNLSGSRTFQDFVGSSDTNDYYRFNLTADSNFRLTLNGLSEDADVQLLNSSGAIIQSSAAAGVNPESIIRQLVAGTYYIRVYPYSGSTNYTLGLTASATTQTDGAGETLATARNIGVLSGDRAFRDFVGPADINDYYRFSLSETSTFRLTLSGLSADADVKLLDSSGQLIQGSYGENTLSESITRTLNAGTYYIRVYPYTGSTTYNLALNATALSTTIDRAGNTLATARNLSTLTGSRTFQDFVGSSDVNDYYRFNLAQASNFNLALNGLTAAADVQLLDSNGGVIQQSIAAGTTPEFINRTLAAGTYYVRVYSFNGANSGYQLVLGATVATAGFNSVYGYGLVDAAAAVARALGRANPFPNVANLGGNNWGNDMVNAPEAWAGGYRGQRVIVAVVDTGVDYNHPDLRNNIWVNTAEIAGNGIDDDRNGYVDDVRGWDFIGRDNNPMDEESHGTHVAGTIAASNNGFGATGVAHGARIMPVRVLGPDGGSDSAVANGIRYAVDNGATVINLSLGGDFPSPTIQSALQYATARGAFVVMAAGNDGDPAPDFPARYATQYGVSIGAVDINRIIASFSNRAGTNSGMRHIVAPGVSIYSTTPGNTYGFLSGTSMATPHVAGVVALMLSANSRLTHAQIRQILIDSAVERS